jgi:hypothetical protein
MLTRPTEKSKEFGQNQSLRFHQIATDTLTEIQSILKPEPIATSIPTPVDTDTKTITYTEIQLIPIPK